MPIYEYLCENCKYEFSQITTLSKREIPCEQPCCECGEERVIQKISQTQIGDPIVMGLKKPSTSFQEVMKHHASKPHMKDLKKKI